MGFYNSENDIIGIEDKNYPKLLRKIGKDAPRQIYHKGNIDLLKSDCLAVVGSRRMTIYGKQICEKIVGQAASMGLTIVSGFMYGVDAAAHKAAVDAEGKTIAVMPCGIDLVHPDHQVKLYDEILQSGGLIISEYEGKIQPALYTYPQRNRIVAGISRAVLVIEAAEKSGSLITAKLALKYKRKLFAVPGPATSIVSRGTNELIKKGKAEMVLEAEDILKWFGRKSGEARLSQERPDLLKSGAQVLGRSGLLKAVGPLESLILHKLEAEPLEIDLLARELRKPISELNTIIMTMQIKGQVKNINGKLYVY